MSLRTNDKLNRLAARLLGPLAKSDSYFQLNNLLGKDPDLTHYFITNAKHVSPILLNAAKNISIEDQLRNSFRRPLATKESMSSILPVLGNEIVSHPVTTAGLALGAGANIVGLTDNKYIGGQLAGGGLGALSAYLIPKLFNGTSAAPMSMIAGALGGGTLGSVFDKLREQKDSWQNPYTY